MEDSSENTYTAKTWFQLKCEDPRARDLWIKARFLCTFKKISITALYLFEYDISESQQQSSRALSQKALWSSEVHGGIRILFDRIVTRWIPARLSQDFRMSAGLHNSLTPEHLFSVPQIFDNSQHDLNFNVATAQKRYEQCFVPLLYHELWGNIKHDIKSTGLKDLFSTAGDIEIQITNYVPQITRAAHQSERSTPTTLIFSSYSFQIDLSFTRTFPKLGLCDIVLINIGLQHDRRSFFAIVVHVNDDWPLDDCNDEKHIIDVNSNIVLYTSKQCSDAVGKQCTRSGKQSISVIKLSNITSSRRHISAIYNLRTFSKQKSLLKPSDADPYFLHEDIPDVAIALGNFNMAQKQVIMCAERMFRNNTNDRLHLVHGPPGTGKSKTIAGIVVMLLLQLDKNSKILLCAPSNNACDELSKRILNELAPEYETGTLVRVGREAPLDHDVCEHFLESLTMKKLVEKMQNEQSVTYKTADTIKQKILHNAKVIVSTLNYSTNNTLISMKRRESVKFIIVDEACQSLEADCLLPFYFGCSKIILVGDPKQLPPCVLSTAGENHNLSQSLYTRLETVVRPQDISRLTTQYRMHEEICQFPSNHFYDGVLITDESAMNYWLDYPLQPYYLYNLIYTRHTCPPNGGSSDNKEERIFIRKFCVKLLEVLVGRGPYVKNNREFIEMEKRIVVITPYKKQMTKFRERALEFPRHIEVMTVDSAQGKEKDIVLISCVRSGVGTIGFLKDQHRLNVMLTRARRALYVFGNLTWLAEQNADWNALVDDAEDRQVINTIRSADEDVVLPS